jgi:hypothetical protein
VQLGRRCNLARERCLCALVASLGGRRRRWCRSHAIPSLPPGIGFVGCLLKVASTLLDNSKVLVLNHGMGFSTHMIRDGHPVGAEVCNVLVKVSQLRD